MRYEDVRRSRGADGLFSRLRLFFRALPNRRTPISSVTDLSDRERADIGVPLGFDRPVDWWRFR